MRHLAGLLFLAAVLAAVLTCPIYAEPTATTPEQLWQEFRQGLPSFSEVQLPEELEDITDLKQKLGFTALFSQVVESLKNGITQERPMFLGMLGITLLFSAAALLAPEKGGVSMAMSGAAAFALCQLLSDSFARISAYFEDLGRFATLLSPSFMTVLAAGGGSGTAAAAGVAFSSFISVLEVLCTGLLLPLLRVLLALILVSAIGNTTATSELVGSLRGFYLFVLSLTAALFAASLAFETGLATVTDSVAGRTVKFAVGNAIPVVGGTVAAALGSLTASLSLVKTAFGASAVAVLCALVLPLLAELFLLRLMLSLCHSLASVMGAVGMQSLLQQLRGLYDLMLATVSMTSALFLLLCGVLARCSLPLGQ